MAYHKLRAPKVFVPNDSYHDYSGAKRFGDLVFITEGRVNRKNVNDITRKVAEALEEAEAHDFVVISSLSVINSITCAVMAMRFKRLNLLLFDDHAGSYFSRTVILEKLAQKG